MVPRASHIRAATSPDGSLPRCCSLCLHASLTGDLTQVAVAAATGRASATAAVLHKVEKTQQTNRSVYF